MNSFATLINSNSPSTNGKRLIKPVFMKVLHRLSIYGKFGFNFEVYIGHDVISTSNAFHLSLSIFFNLIKCIGLEMDVIRILVKFNPSYFVYKVYCQI